MEEKKTISHAELLEWREDMIKLAQSNILTDGQLVPVTLMMMQDPDSGNVGMAVMEMDMSSEQAKDMASMKIRFIASNNTVYGLVFMSEVWMAKAESKEELESEDFIPPSQREDKQEALMVTFESEGDNIMTIYDIVRNDDGVVVGFKEQVNDDIGSFEGRFANFLSKASK